MSPSTKFNWSCVVLSAIIFCAAIPAISDPSFARTINPAQQQIPLPGSPFAALTTADGRYVFVSFSSDDLTTGGVAVLQQKKKLAAVVQMVPTCGPALGMAMSKGGRYLLVAVQPGPSGTSCPSGGVQFIDAQKAIAGDDNAAMGTVPTDPTAIEVAISPDNKLVFVANEFSGGKTCEMPMAGDAPTPDTVSVIDLQEALSSGQSPSSVKATVPVDCGVVGLAVSSDSRYLYVTNETALPTRSFFDQTACSIPTGKNCPVKMYPGAVGTLDVVDIGTVQTNPAGSVLAAIAAGCSPTRVILRNNDQIAWVSARDQNNLLAFNALDIITNPSAMPLATVPVGIAPDGVQPFSHGRFMAVANTNRFDSCKGAGGTVSILNIERGLYSKTVGTFNAGVFPRQWALSPNGKLLYLTEYGSDILAIFPIGSIVHQLQ
jgi:DNA-binding beta-propeller fold protein YncE